ncbi:TetR/AcrR family transcriptional regulator [Brucella sp. JSBI001]|uniref:TetR/AcrR family transcriptional regulator n=1 Tax=Brucella sp. JSBI001 TaxID=2886044 RepID=UPI00223201E5|nr:TetR/AcrR family transcriptional regulator [Brucella sp. JSBI001]UZD69373.1 TetR/AcrR family transcriptional regulator [Brucella sp. JSBI001]
MAAVADEAGMGMSALYRRYESKDRLLEALCRGGLERYVAEARQALADEGDPWDALAGFMRRVIEAETHTLVLLLAGAFPPSPDLFDLAAEAQALNERIFLRARNAGRLRPDADVNDLNVIGELVATVSIGDGPRNKLLRQRYLSILLDGLSQKETDPLPEPGPSWDEMQSRWR